jgi:hypothetical protein
MPGRFHAGLPKTHEGYSFPEILLPFRLATAENYAEIPTATHERIVALNGILESARLHLGYRAANEMALFMAIYNEMLPPDPNDTAWERALDVAVLQKVLPRLSGNRAKLEKPLARLCFYLRNRTVPSPDADLDEFAPEATAVFPKAYRRAVEMLSSLRDFGFVSFFK